MSYLVVPCFVCRALFYFILFRFVFFRYVLSCLLLSCLIFKLFCFVLFCFVLFQYVLFCFVLSLVLSLVQSCHVLSCLVVSSFVLSCLVLPCLALSQCPMHIFRFTQSLLKRMPLSTLQHLLRHCRYERNTILQDNVPTWGEACGGQCCRERVGKECSSYIVNNSKGKGKKGQGKGEINLPNLALVTVMFSAENLHSGALCGAHQLCHCGGTNGF